mgnify:FL=1
MESTKGAGLWPARRVFGFNILDVGSVLRRLGSGGDYGMGACSNRPSREASSPCTYDVIPDDDDI